jgi:S-formylglutathione hydrolase FrmB
MKSLRINQKIGRALFLFLALLTSVLTSNAQTASVETVQFHSTLINATLPYNVILPRDYRASRTTRYPVLYLLHGLTGHYPDWLTRTNVADYASQYRMIVVMPEGNDSWYVDGAPIKTATGTARPGDKYESYILQELLPDVDKRYRTVQSRYGRAIAGLSMGGYGAIKFGLKHPSTFAFAGSMSGALAAASWTEDEMKTVKSVYDSLPPVFGPTGSEVRKANDIFQIVEGLPASRVAALPYFYLDSGTEDFFFEVNHRFAEVLREKKIPHEYRELPGDHSWQYWDRQVKEVLKISAEKLRASSLPEKRWPQKSTKGTNQSVK